MPGKGLVKRALSFAHVALFLSSDRPRRHPRRQEPVVIGASERILGAVQTLQPPSVDSSSTPYGQRPIGQVRHPFWRGEARLRPSFVESIRHPSSTPVDILRQRLTISLALFFAGPLHHGTGDLPAASRRCRRTTRAISPRRVNPTLGELCARASVLGPARRRQSQ